MSPRPSGRSKAGVWKDVMALWRRKRGRQEGKQEGRGGSVRFESPGKEFSYYFLREKSNICFQIITIGILL